MGRPLEESNAKTPKGVRITESCAKQVTKAQWPEGSNVTSCESVKEFPAGAHEKKHTLNRSVDPFFSTHKKSSCSLQVSGSLLSVGSARVAFDFILRITLASDLFRAFVSFDAA